MGSGGGLHQLIEEHYQGLYRYAYRLSGSAADAEDLTQEAFRKAIDRLPQLRDPDRAKAWLFRILRNAYLHRVRDAKRHRAVPLDAVGDLPTRPADEPPDVDPARLQEALAFLRRHGRKPYFLFERSEEAAFKAHFASHDPLGTLEWPPVADIDRVVHVFDPDDYARYTSGVYVPTQQIRSRRR